MPVTENRVEVGRPIAALPHVRPVTVQSAALGRRADLTIVSPHPLPSHVVVLLHGVYGSHWAWLHQGGLLDAIERLADQQGIPSFAVVTPSDGLWGEGSGFVSIGTEDHEAWIVDDVPDAVRRAIGLSTNVEWSIAGLSMGGFGALRLAARHPDRYAAAWGMSSVTSVAELRRFGLMMPSAECVVDVELASLLTERPPRRFGFSCGSDDPLRASNRAMHNRLISSGVDHVYAEHEGGHEWPVWERLLPATLEFLLRTEK